MTTQQEAQTMNQTIAQQIARNSNPSIQADALAVDRDQDCENASTTFTFEDGSRLRVSGCCADVLWRDGWDGLAVLDESDGTFQAFFPGSDYGVAGSDELGWGVVYADNAAEIPVMMLGRADNRFDTIEEAAAAAEDLSAK